MVTRRNALSSLLAGALALFTRRATAQDDGAPVVALDESHYSDERYFVRSRELPYVGPTGPASDGRYGHVPDAPTAWKRGIKGVTVDGIDFTRVAIGGDDRAGYVIVREWEGYPAPPDAESRLVNVPVADLTEPHADFPTCHVRVRPTRVVLGNVRFIPKVDYVVAGPNPAPYTPEQLAVQERVREALRAAGHEFGALAFVNPSTTWGTYADPMGDFRRLKYLSSRDAGRDLARAIEQSAQGGL